MDISLIDTYPFFFNLQNFSLSLKFFFDKPKIHVGIFLEDFMKKLFIGLFCIISASWLFAQSQIIAQEAYASYYGEEFHGRQTANGEIYDMNAFTAAHRTLPFGSVLEVSNLDNGTSVFVRVNDRGPFVANREIDLSKAAANAIGMIQQGIARVSIKLVSSPTPINQTTVQNTATAVPQAIDSNLIYIPATKTEGLVLWRIQLGSFTHEENALTLVEDLRKVGFEPAYEKTSTHIRVVLYGIRQGDLDKVKNVLNTNNFKNYIIRQESW